MPSPRLSFLAAAAFLFCAGVARAAAPVDFAREILPILSDACYKCHGPDEGSRKAKLRLDTKEGLYRTRNDVTVVKPGAPADSELLFRLVSTDAEEVMPPRDAVRQLKPAEIALLQRWVAEGAPYGTHWAFAPVAAVTPPIENQKSKIENPAVLTLADLAAWSFSGTALAVLGHPIKHSISPAMHNAALAALAATDARYATWRYFRFEVHPDDLPRALEQLKEKNFHGL
eukprot:gene45463-biopygen36318